METRAVGRFEWERIVRRLVMPDHHKLAALLLASWGDNDGTRVRPGTELLGGAMGKSDRTARRILASLVREWGLLELVTRGGGRGGRGKTAEYRLSVPLDLLDRFVLLGPDGLPDSPATQVAAQSAAEMSDGCGQLPSTDVDNSESLATQMAGQSLVDNSNDRPKTTPSDGMTGHLGPIDRPLRWPTTAFDQSTKTTRDQSPPSATTDRADEIVDNPIPPHGRTLDDVLPLSKPPKPPPEPRCPRHFGGRGGRHPDGRPRCPLCRRDAVLDAEPIPVPELTPPEQP